jgi:hypothetical protein
MAGAAARRDRERVRAQAKRTGPRPMLRVAPPPRIDLPDGATAELRGGALELRDPEDRLLVRYENGSAEIFAPAGDLKLAAPHGRVVVSSGSDVHIEAAREVRTVARGASFDVERIAIRSKVASLVMERAQLAASTLEIAAERMSTSAEQVEVIADRLVHKSRDSFREVSELAEERVGRLKTFVKQAFTLTSRRTSMRSTEETSIDGKRVLLG